MTDGSDSAPAASPLKLVFKIFLWSFVAVILSCGGCFAWVKMNSSEEYGDCIDSCLQRAEHAVNPNYYGARKSCEAECQYHFD